MSDKTYVCSKCGAEKSLSRLVEVEGWEAVEIEEEGGKLTAIATGDREVDWRLTSDRNYHCSECGQEMWKLEDAVRVRHDLECRTCGWAGADESEHPNGCDGEVLGGAPPETHPEQQSLAVSP